MPGLSTIRKCTVCGRNPTLVYFPHDGRAEFVTESLLVDAKVPARGYCKNHMPEGFCEYCTQTLWGKHPYDRCDVTGKLFCRRKECQEAWARSEASWEMEKD